MLKDIFENHSTIVYGAKGKGKDVLFQKVIFLRKKSPYESNIDYGYMGKKRDIKDLSIEPNTYLNFINGNIEKIKCDLSHEGVDYYLSDGGVYLPSQYNNELNKRYPSLPLYYALSRQLYNSNIHTNTQALGRLWIMIREQADYYIKCRKMINLPFIMIGCLTLYDKYESAEQNLLPLGSRLFNKFSRAEVDLYNAKNGLIEKRFYIIRKKDIVFNTRHFRDVLFNTDIPTELNSETEKEWGEFPRLVRRVASSLFPSKIN